MLKERREAVSRLVRLCADCSVHGVGCQMRKMMTMGMAMVKLRMGIRMRVVKVRKSLRWANISVRIGIMGITQLRTCMDSLYLVGSLFIWVYCGYWVHGVCFLHCGDFYGTRIPCMRRASSLLHFGVVFGPCCWCAFQSSCSLFYKNISFSSMLCQR
jgi:hypothetical protein